MISVKEARRVIDDHISIVPQEKVSINVAEGRVLAQDIVASFPQPRFNNSAMDGLLSVLQIQKVQVKKPQLI